jgi:hypothetical protein
MFLNHIFSDLTIDSALRISFKIIVTMDEMPSFEDEMMCFTNARMTIVLGPSKSVAMLCSTVGVKPNSVGSPILGWQLLTTVYIQDMYGRESF